MASVISLPYFSLLPLIYGKRLDTGAFGNRSVVECESEGSGLDMRGEVGFVRIYFSFLGRWLYPSNLHISKEGRHGVR